MCLRPCQEVVGPAEYRNEVDRVVEFLRTDGHSLVDAIGRSRDRLSEEMMFEEAARQHKRLEQVQEILKLRDELVCDIDRLYGVAVAPCTTPESVLLWFFCQGSWQLPLHFPLTSHVSLDHRLRELVASIQPTAAPLGEKQEHLAMLARWHYSTWSDGEWIGFRSLEEAPYRRLVRARWP